ncbi:hypothetical protein [Micromonospora sp. SH-82]|uniref:hypothetical protein n=1 Tax=Micromonospora sp. SH-82 TaxID=3132938 RepID=UPI003EB70759
MRRRRLMIATLLALGMAGAGCGGTDADRATGGDGERGADSDSFAGRLALLPDSLLRGDDPVLVTVADLEAAAKAAGVTPPTDVSDPAAVTAYVNAVTGTTGRGGPPPTVAAPLPDRVVPGGVAQAQEFEAELGWSVVDLRWFVEYPTTPATLTVAGGTFTEQRLTEAMGDPDNGRWRVGEGEDMSMNLRDRSAARPTGQPLTVALDSDRLFVSPTAGHVQAALGSGGTLADLPELRTLAEAMDKQGAYAAMLYARGPFEAGPGPGGAPTLRPFDGVATGLVHDGEPFLVLAYAHGDAGAAEANATALRTLLTEGRSLRGQPWSELLTVADITTDGTTVVARLGLGSAGPQIAWQLLQTRDNLIQHGG